MKYLNELIYRVTELVFEQLINEARFEVLKQKYAMKLLDFLHTTDEQSRAVKLMISGDERDGWFGYKKGDQKDAEELFSWFGDIDPTDNKKYVEWLIRGILSKKTTWEKLYTTDTLDLLAKFEKIKKVVPGTDINKMSLDDLEIFVEENEDAISSRQLKSSERKELENGFYRNQEALLLHNSSNFKVVAPLTHKASCFFGQMTKWCTAAKDDSSMFDSYLKSGRLYVVLDRATKNLFQFHFTDMEFRNAEDDEINIFKFLKNRPELVSFFLTEPEFSENKLSSAFGELPDPFEEAQKNSLYSLLNEKATPEYTTLLLDSILTNQDYPDYVSEMHDVLKHVDEIILRTIMRHLSNAFKNKKIERKILLQKTEIIKQLLWSIMAKIKDVRGGQEKELIDFFMSSFRDKTTKDTIDSIMFAYTDRFSKENAGEKLPDWGLRAVYNHFMNRDLSGEHFHYENVFERLFTPYLEQGLEDHELKLLDEILRTHTRQARKTLMNSYEYRVHRDTGLSNHMMRWVKEFKFTVEFYSRTGLPVENIKEDIQYLKRTLDTFEDNKQDEAFQKKPFERLFNAADSFKREINKILPDLL